MKWSTAVFILTIFWLIIALMVYSTTNPYTATPMQILTVAVVTVMGMVLFVLGIIALAYDIASGVKEYFERRSRRRD